MAPMTLRPLIAAALVLAAAPATAKDRTVWLYCEGSPPATVRSSLAYVTQVFGHRLNVEKRSIDRATARFRDRVSVEYGDTIGANCFQENSRNAAEAERAAFIRHRRANGYAVELLP